MLDLGCGAGRFVAALRDAGADPVGVEIAEAALERARRNAPGADLRLLEPDGSLPLEHGSVDLVWCSEVLEHVADTEHLLLEARRVLRRGGRLLITVPFHGRVKAALIGLLRFERHFDPTGPAPALLHGRLARAHARRRGLRRRPGAAVGRPAGAAHRPRGEGAAPVAPARLASRMSEVDAGVFGSR